MESKTDSFALYIMTFSCLPNAQSTLYALTLIFGALFHLQVRYVQLKHASRDDQLTAWLGTSLGMESRMLYYKGHCSMLSVQYQSSAQLPTAILLIEVFLLASTSIKLLHDALHTRFAGFCLVSLLHARWSLWIAWYS